METKQPSKKSIYYPSSLKDNFSLIISTIIRKIAPAITVNYNSNCNNHDDDDVSVSVSVGIGVGVGNATRDKRWLPLPFDLYKIQERVSPL